MVDNPERASRGGDVGGMTAMDVTMGNAIMVASASYDPGYPLETTLDGIPKDDLKRGYCKDGKATGG